MTYDVRNVESWFMTLALFFFNKKAFSHKITDVIVCRERGWATMLILLGVSIDVSEFPYLGSPTRLLPCPRNYTPKASHEAWQNNEDVSTT